jgi:predicted nucleic-acid-binding Zn-ribbon protein
VKSHGSCPKCGSLRIVREALIPDHTDASSGTPLSLRIEENPSATLFRSPRDFPLRAWACGDCGYTELYVTQPEQVLAAETRARQVLANVPPGSISAPGEPPQRAFLILVVTLAIVAAVGLGALVLLIVRLSP